MSIIASYFSIYAFKELSRIDELRFIFTEPMFEDYINLKENFSLEQIDSEKLFAGNKYELKLRNKLTQANIAKECAEWIKEKVQLKASKFPRVVESKFIHIKNNRKEDLRINNTNDFSSSGLVELVQSIGYIKSN